MTRLATIPAILGIIVSGTIAVGLPAGCRSNKVEIGQQNVDGQAPGLDAAAGKGGAGSGGVTGSGGVAATGGTTRTAGTTGVGGATQTGGVTAAGGSTPTGGTGPAGGTTGAGGATRTGGATGAGGTTAAGGAGGTGKICGGLAGLPCAAGETCDIQPGHCCCDYTGTCVAQPQVCTALYQPVCGCDGKTYSNDCVRLANGMSKNFDGACPTTDAGAGGSTGTGGTTGAGGATRTGGATGTGGTTRTGGTTGTGGTGGSTGKTCGGVGGVSCPAGQFCDLQAGSCNVSDATGTCVVDVGVGCIAIYQPVCGCDGKTYSSDCVRQSAGLSKKSDGTCPTTDASAGTCSQVTTQAECDSRSDCHSVFLPGTTCACAAVGCCQLFNRCADGGRANCTGPVACLAAQPVCLAPYALSYTNVCFEGCVLQSECASADGGVKDAPTDLGTTRYATAYLQWEAPGGIAGTGPAIVVGGAGWADTWTRVNAFSPETPPSSATGTYTLTTAVVDDLFARLASVNFSQLPHPGTGWECSPSLYFRLCTGCTATTLSYDVPSELLPEMESVWAWFDQLLGATDYTNPRTYCNP